MLGVVRHRDRLVDEKHRNAVFDAVRTAKPGVIEELVVDQQQRPTIFRADEDAQQLFVEHDRRLADRLIDGRTWDADVDARALARGRWHPGWLHRAHARRRLADAEVVPGLLARIRVLHLSLQLAL